MLLKLKPPKISSKTICQKIVCTRPTKPGCFRLAQETIEGRDVISCTGHGGSGWTTLFGYIAEAIKRVPKDQPIRIVGSGCMGLTAAIELKRAGYLVSGITTKDLYDSASWRAAGYFALIKIEASKEEQLLAYEMGIKTFETFQQIERGRHPYLGKECVRFLPVYSNQKMTTGVEKLEEMGLIPPKKEVTLDFGGKAVHKNYFMYMTYFMNTSCLMLELLAEVKRLAIPITLKEIDSFQDVEEDVILNCTGMGSIKLAKDAQMHGVRGHLLMLNDPTNLSHTDYMIYTTVEQEGKEEYLYMFPKNLSVTPDCTEGLKTTATLGGTFLPDIDLLPEEVQRECDRKEFEKMLSRHKTFFYGEKL